MFETNTALYNDALNNSTPTQQELDMASGGSSGNPPYEGGVSVDFGSERGDNVLPCSQNAPTFVASSLLPKTTRSRRYLGPSRCTSSSC